MPPQPTSTTTTTKQQQTTSRHVSPSLSHFVIFNPTIKPPPNDAGRGPTSKPVDEEEEEDKDLRDDLLEAAQILFYTSREAGGVSRDVMLRQVGLAKGLMGFAEYVPTCSFSFKWYDLGLNQKGRTNTIAKTRIRMAGSEKPKFHAIHSQKSRLLIFSPEPDFYVYLVSVRSCSSMKPGRILAETMSLDSL